MCLTTTDDPAAALERMAEWVESIQPVAIHAEKTCDLLVVSCVLSQLHVVSPPQKPGQVGRLYHVQALLLSVS